MSHVYFLETVEPNAAQREHCDSVRKAEAANKWLCRLSDDGNASMFGGGQNAITHAEARAMATTEEFNGAVSQGG